MRIPQPQKTPHKTAAFGAGLAERRQLVYKGDWAQESFVYHHSTAKNLVSAGRMGRSEAMK